MPKLLNAYMQLDRQSVVFGGFESTKSRGAACRSFTLVGTIPRVPEKPTDASVSGASENVRKDVAQVARSHDRVGRGLEIRALRIERDGAAGQARGGDVVRVIAHERGARERNPLPHRDGAERDPFSVHVERRRRPRRDGAVGVEGDPVRVNLVEG